MVDTKPHIEEYKGFFIIDVSNGFFSLHEVSDGEGKVIVFLVEQNSIHSYFSFYTNPQKISGDPKPEQRLQTDAVGKIKEYIEKGLINNFGIYTFEMKDSSYKKVENPKWWGSIARDYRF